MTQAAPAREVPEHVPAGLVRYLDHYRDDAALADPSGYLDDLREEWPIFYSPAYEGFWVLTRFEDIRWVFQNPELFSSDPMGIPGWTPGGIKLIPVMLDPPEHGKYRALINPAFAPARIRALEPAMRRTIRDLVAKVAPEGGCEFVRDIAEPYSTRMFAQMLGLPVAEGPRFAAWNAALLHTTFDGTEDHAARERAELEVVGFLAQLIAQRRARPKEDMISALVTAEVDGRRLDDDETLRICMILFMAGLDTVTAAHGFAWKLLAGRPDLRSQIAEDPGVVPSAVEELLRYNAIFADARTVTREVEVLGVTMRPGDRVLLPTFTGSRDPAVFPDPHTVDLRRKPNTHLAFAAGPHRCIGSHLARQEMAISLTEWHSVIPDYRISDPKAVRVRAGGLAGVEHLPLSW